ncbi:MAG: aminoacyl--tRNA ligase-related protein, partial [bacterium]|nr:aminoacyl--tRNA ligase-related protein [bacterium]
MLDIKFIRENKEIVELGAKKKHMVIDIGKLLELDDRRRELMSSSEKKRAEQNSYNDIIAKTGVRGERNALIAEMTVIKAALQKEEEELKGVMKDWQALMLQVPNVPDMSVPNGASDADNVEVKVWGDKPEFSFEPKDHLQLMTALGMADFERGAKVHGFRGYFLTGAGAELSFAIWNYATDFFRSKGFTLVIPPVIVRKQNLYGTGHLPGDVEDYYVTQDGDALAGTSEVPMMGFYAEEIIDSARFPLKYLAFSPCFRREAGSHSKDVKGLIRVHEFFKFEQIVLCESNHETSVKFHEEINRNTEEFIESLK